MCMCVCVCVGVCSFMLYSAMTDPLPVDVGSCSGGG